MPGDEIIGYITKGKGVAIHRADCVNLNDLLSEEERIVGVKWYNAKTEDVYNATIIISSNDRTGLLSDIVREIMNKKINIMAVNTNTNQERIATIEIEVEIKDTNQLNDIMKELRKVESVFNVERKK